MQMGKSTIDSQVVGDGVTLSAPAGGAQLPPDSSGTSSGGGLTRVTVNLTRQAVAALDELSEGTGYSKTDTINRALQVSALVHEIMRRSGGSLQIVNADGQVERVHIV
jgi:hypothetical protein